MKHPGLERNRNQMEYSRLFYAHAGRYLIWSFSGLLIICAIAYLLFRPEWPTAVMAILYSSGFVLCISISAMLGKRRALAVLKETDT